MKIFLFLTVIFILTRWSNVSSAFFLCFTHSVDVFIFEHLNLIFKVRIGNRQFLVDIYLSCFY